MRLTSVLLAVCCWLSAVSGQYLEHTIDLSGPLGSVRALDCIAVNPSNHTVYVGGDSWVAVIDGGSASYLGRIPVSARCVALCYVAEENKLFAACIGSPDSTVLVIDCATNQVRARVEVGVRPQSLCYDPVCNKVYVGNYMSNSVSVMDAAGDTLLATIPVGPEPKALCYNPVERKVYCANYGSDDVTVIDATADTVVATVTVGRGPVSLCVNPRDNKVYCGARHGGHLTIIGGAEDTVLATLAVGGAQFGLGYSPLTDHVYCANEDFLAVIDGVGDSTIGFILRGYPAASVLYNPVNHKLYVASNDGRMAVLDGATDSLRSLFTLPGETRRLAMDASLNRVFGAYLNTPSVACVDGAGDSLIAAVRLGVVPRSLCYNPVTDRVYTTNYENCGSVSVIDAATNTLVTTIPVGGAPWSIACDSIHNKVYVANRAGHGSEDSVVVVIDCEGDTVVARVPTSLDPTDLYSNPSHPKMYSVGYAGGGLSVIDEAADTVMKRLPTPSFLPGVMAYNVAYGKLYVADELTNQLMVVDGAGDFLRAVVPVWANGFTIHYNPRNEKLYTMTPSPFTPYVTVVSGRTDSIIKIIDGVEVELACQHPSKSQIFMMGMSQVVVIDGQGDSVLTRISIPGNTGTDIEYDVAHDRVYCSDGRENSVTVIDALTYHVIKSIPVGFDPVDMVWVPRHSRVFVANFRGSSVSVIRDTSLAVEDRPPMEAALAQPTLVLSAVVLSVSVPGVVVDVVGRRVATLKTGSNRIRLPGAGVYYVVPADGRACRKLICVEH